MREEESEWTDGAGRRKLREKGLNASVNHTIIQVYFNNTSIIHFSQQPLIPLHTYIHLSYPHNPPHTHTKAIFIHPQTHPPTHLTHLIHIHLHIYTHPFIVTNTYLHTQIHLRSSKLTHTLSSPHKTHPHTQSSSHPHQSTITFTHCHPHPPSSTPSHQHTPSSTATVILSHHHLHTPPSTHSPSSTPTFIHKPTLGDAWAPRMREWMCLDLLMGFMLPPPAPFTSCSLVRSRHSRQFRTATVHTCGEGWGRMGRKGKKG